MGNQINEAASIYLPYIISEVIIYFRLLFQVALILLALAAVVAADSYGKSGYGGGYKTDYAVR